MSDRDLLRQLIRSTTEMAEQLKRSGKGSTQKNIVEKLDKFDGTRGQESRNWLGKFTTWATYSGDFLNHKDWLGNWIADEDKWIVSALGLMGGKATEWAQVYLTEIQEDKAPFNWEWSQFVESFKQCFLVLENTTDALFRIHELRQGRKSVGEYTDEFEMLQLQVPLSKTDLYFRYLTNFSIPIQQEIAKNAASFPTLDELQAHVLYMEQKDNEFQQHTRWQQYWENQRNSQRPSHSSTNVPPPTQINANGNGHGKTIEVYRTWMRGKCYGCGSTEHLKAAGHHEHDQCGHYGRLSHQDLVCQDKFMGKVLNIKMFYDSY